MIEVVELTACDNDVDVRVRLKLTDDSDVRGLYNYVKEQALGIAEHEMYSTQGRRMYGIEMEQNSEGLPCASLYINNEIKKQIFATRRP